MIADLYAFDLSSFMVTLGLVSMRSLVAFALLPMFASRTVPTSVRGAIALAIVFPVACAQLGQAPPVDLYSSALLAFVAKEGAIGAIIGLGFGAFFAGLQIVGEIIDHQTGLTFTQNIDPIHGNNVSLTAQFLERILFAALLLGGAMLAIIDSLYLSYALWPLGQWSPDVERVMTLQLVGHAGKLFALALLLSGPVLLLLFVVDAGMGLLNRAAPQLSIYNITLSLKSLVGLGVLTLALPMLTQRSLLALREVAKTLGTFFMHPSIG
jgi:type III secretion protein T